MSQGKNNSRFIKRKVPQPKYPLTPKNTDPCRGAKIRSARNPETIQYCDSNYWWSSVWKLIHVKVRATRLFQNSWALTPVMYGGVAFIL